MQPRSLSQILAELDTVYQPQIESVRQRQSLIPGQIKAEEAGLKAQEQDYYDNTIMGDARRRGVGFAGIPLGERARYGATQYLPALARLRQSGREQAMSLEDAILGIQERRQNQALGVRQYEQQRYDTYQAQQQALAEQRRQAAAQAGAYSGLFGNQGQGAQTTTPSKPKINQDTQKAYNAVQDLLSTNNPSLIQKTYQAIKKSAGFGNPYDKMKLALIEQLAARSLYSPLPGAVMSQQNNSFPSQAARGFKNMVGL